MFPASKPTLSAMNNGHICPSEYALQLDQHTDHLAMHRAIGDEFRCRYPGDWPTPLVAIFAHREACIVAALRALDAAPAEPKATRQGLRRQMLAAFAAIASVVRRRFRPGLPMSRRGCTVLVNTIGSAATSSYLTLLGRGRAPSRTVAAGR